MTGELCIVLDPFLLQVPSNRQADCTEYLDRLSNWLTYLRTHRDLCLVMRASIDSMINTNHFPHLQDLKSLIAVSQIDITAVDLSRAISEITDREPYFETRFDIEDGLVEDLTVDPEVFRNRLDPNVSNAFWPRLFVRIAEDNSNTLSSLTLATACSDVLPIDYIKLQGKSAMYTNLAYEPFEGVGTADVSLLYINSPPIEHEDLSKCFDDPEKAIRSIAQEKEYQISAEIVSKLSYSSGFVDTLYSTGIVSQAVALRLVFIRAYQALVGTISTTSGAQVHAVRAGKGPKEPQVIGQNNSRLWRCVITLRGAGYRLHYWEFSNGQILLDSVMKESEVIVTWEGRITALK